MFKLKSFLTAMLIVGLVVPLAVSAQSTDEIAKLIVELQRQIAELKVKLAQLQGDQVNKWCHNFKENLGVGTDGDEVLALQTALENAGFHVGDKTGHYGEITAAAVSSFQLKYRDEILTPLGLANPTGYVGPSTRAVLNRLYGCRGSDQRAIIRPFPPPTIPGPTPPIISPFITVISPNGGESWTLESKQIIRWRGDIVGDQKIGLALIDASINNFIPRSTITLGTVNDGAYEWFIPLDFPIGEYLMQVSCVSCSLDAGGSLPTDVSDAPFSISTSTNKPPSIPGVSGPTALKVNETGTWTVTASDPENGLLSYSVNWGDEGTMAGSTATAPTAPTAPVQQTATFTHTYSRAGNYKASFIVTDNAGQSARTSLSVVVGDGGGTTGIDLAVTSFELNSDGPRATFCNKGSETIRDFPLWISVDGVTQVFNMSGYNNPGQNCGLSHQWYYATWGLNSAGYHSAGAQVDPLGIYTEIDESNNWLTATYNSGGTVTPTLQVLSPNGGEVWLKGQTYNVSWGATGAPEVSVYLIRQSDSLRRAIRHNFVSGRANSITWNVPADLSDAEDYRIWVIGGSTVGIEDKSDGNFSIKSSAPPTNPPFVQVKTPNGGETLISGRVGVTTTTWTARGFSAADIFLISVDAAATQATVASRTLRYPLALNVGLQPGGAENFSLGWTPRLEDYGGHSEFVIRICQAGTNFCDESDRPFKIVAQ